MEGTKAKKVKNAKRISSNGKVIRPTSKRISRKTHQSRELVTEGSENQERTAHSKMKPTREKKVSGLNKFGKKHVSVPVIAPKESKKKLRKLADIIDPEAESLRLKTYRKRKHDVKKSIKKKKLEEKPKKLQLKKKKKVAILPVSLKEYAAEDEGGVSEKKVDEAINALLLLLKDDEYKLLGDEGKDIYLQITSYKTPITSPREIRVTLPHSILPESPDVCLFTSDLQKGRRIDHTPTVEHFKELLSNKMVTCISEVITLRQLKTDYDRYEMKRALCNSFDVFLSDAKVCGHISHLLGKTFYDGKKIPIPVKLDAKNLKKHIEEALLKSSYRVHNRGRLFVLKVAHTLLTPQQICDNIMAAVSALKKNFPGGWNNILQLMIKGAKSIPVPFYLSTMKDSLVNLPIAAPLRPKAYRDVSGELPGIGEVLVTPDGEIQILKREEKDELEKELIQKEEQIRLERWMAKQEKKRAKSGRSKDTVNEEEFEFTEEDLYRSDSDEDGEDEQFVIQTKRRRLEARNESDNEEARVEPEITEDELINSSDVVINSLEEAYLQDLHSSRALKSKEKLKKRRK